MEGGKQEVNAGTSVVELDNLLGCLINTCLLEPESDNFLCEKGAGPFLEEFGVSPSALSQTQMVSRIRGWNGRQRRRQDKP